MNDGSVFLIVWTFGWVTLLIVIWQLRVRRADRRLDRIHKERMIAMEKGIPLPEMPDYEEKPGLALQAWSSLRINPKWPLGIGAIFVMLGLGLMLALVISKEGYQDRSWGVGLLGVFFGVGLWLHYFLTRR
jgi:hypothetical protein